ncbi:MAG: isocitrate/isopropylmalate family dehydrogenase [Ruegeria sp.]|nr:isocitrate/isopropylmalate family dehydrogenase [Ruegeria sp.]
MANPIGSILSVAMMFEYGFRASAPARAIEDAVEQSLASGIMTPDLGREETTQDVTRAVLARLRN